MIEGERAVEIGHLEVDMADPHAGVDRRKRHRLAGGVGLRCFVHDKSSLAFSAADPQM
jgi:hypothetical protein